MPLQDCITVLEENNFEYRVVYQDGQYFFVTQDYRADRYNLNVENNLIIDCFLG
jgi:hypothetical protein